MVVANARTARDKKPIEVVGSYNPIPQTSPETGKLEKDVQLDPLRIKYWLSVGAQPSDTVHRLLATADILPPKPRAGAK